MLKNWLEQRDGSSSSPQMGVRALGRPAALPAATAASPRSVRRWSCWLLHEVADSYEIVDRGGEGKHPVDSADTPVASLTHEAHGLEPAKDLLDELALLL